MGKKRRALSSPQKFKARYRQLRGTPSTTASTDNSVMIAKLAEQKQREVETPTPVMEEVLNAAEVEPAVEPVAEAVVETPTVAPAVTAPTIKKTSSTRSRTSTRKKSTRTRRTKASKADSTKAE